MRTVVFHQRLSSTKGRLPPKVVFHQVDLIFVRTVNTPNLSLLPCLEVASPPRVVFHQRLSSRQGSLPSKVVFHQRLSFTYFNTLVDHKFVRTVIIPNLSLLPCLEVASPRKVVFHQRSTEGYLPLQVIFHRMSSSTEVCLPPQ